MRNTGKTYTKRKGAVVADRRMGQSCKCEKTYIEVLERKDMENIFNDFWNMRDHDKQNVYLFGQIRENPPQKIYTQ